MAFKTILTHLDGSPALTQRVTLAARLARQQQAHLVGVAPAGVAMVPGDVFLGTTAGMLAELQSELDAAALEAASHFERVCEQIGVDSYESRPIGNVPVETLLTQARYSDLMILGQPDDQSKSVAADRSLIEHVVLGTGKPAIVVPYAGNFETMGQKVMFAWDGSREASRAAMDALPILTGAESVEVIVVNGDSAPVGRHGPVPGTDIALYLARHGVNAQVRDLKSDIDVGNTLLSHAADTGADMIVMGAYGHSRLLEWVWGGATRTILDSMTVPVFLSH